MILFELRISETLDLDNLVGQVINSGKQNFVVYNGVDLING